MAQTIQSEQEEAATFEQHEQVRCPAAKQPRHRCGAGKPGNCCHDAKAQLHDGDRRWAGI